MAHVLNSILESESGANEFRNLMNHGASPREIVAAIAARSDGEMATLAWEEFRDLPRSFLTTWLVTWRLAEESGQSFELVSEPAPRPLEYAKAGRVAYRIEHDNDGVRMYVNHVQGYHADWFKPAPEGIEAPAV